MYMSEIYFQSLDRVFMRIQYGCQGRQRRLYSLDSYTEYAYTLAAIDKSGGRGMAFSRKLVDEWKEADMRIRAPT